MMGRTDYQNVARILRGIPGPHDRRNAVVSACQLFAGSNPRFDRVRFLKEAGYWPCNKDVGCYEFFESPIACAVHMEIHKEEVENASQESHCEEDGGEENSGEEAYRDRCC